MRVALISSCTNRKKLVPSPELLARNLPSASLAELARDWTRRVNAATRTVRARDLYAGRAFTETVAAAQTARASCYIVSAGLGLIDIEKEVPAYGLTVAGNDPDSILRKVLEGQTKPRDWWAALNAALGHNQPLRNLIEHQTDCLVVIALPSSYMELIADDLGDVAGAAISRIRIIGLPSLRRSIPGAAATAFVPYDERLESAHTGAAGTRSDFPQRAARHFIASILSQTNALTESSAQHAVRVSDFLAKFSRPSIPARERYSDDMIKDVIRAIWDESQGRVTNGLRLLRRKRQIACEQSRFKRLFWEVAAEKGAGR
jgi:hypothetical protein